MAFTHQRPAAFRSYLVAMSVSTDGTETTESLKDYVYEGWKTFRASHDGTKVNRSYSESSSTDLAGTQTTRTDGGIESRSTYVFENLQEKSAVSSSYYSYSSNNVQTNSTFSSEQGRTVYSSYNSSLTTNTDETYRTTNRTFGEGYTEVSSTKSGYGYTSVKDGGSTRFSVSFFTSYFSSSNTGISTFYTTIDGTGVFTTRPNSFSKLETGGGTPTSVEQTYNFQPETITQRTAFETTTRLIGKRKTETATTSSTYTSFAGSFTDTASFSFKTTETTSTSTADQTIYIMSADTVTLTNIPFGTYLNYAVLGGAYFGTGGTTLENGLIKSASTATSIKAAFKQPILEQSMSHGAVSVNETNTFSTIGISSTTGLTTSTVVTSSTKKSGIGATTTTYTNSVDFGKDVTTGLVFTESTYRSNFFTTSEVNIAFITTTSTTTRRNGFTYTLLDYENVQTSFESLYVGSDDYEIYTYTGSPSLPNITVTNLSAYEFITNETRSNYGATYRWIKNPSQPSNHLIFVNQTRYGKSLITFDKISGNGVQYKTSSDLSGAIRGSKNVTIADEKITTTTTEYTDSENPLILTVNTGESGSYESCGLPLVSAQSLNRYATFLPQDGYGDMAFEIYDSELSRSSGRIHLSKIKAGSSIARYTKEITYSTSNSNGSNTITADTVLNGLIKIEVGENSSDELQNATPITYNLSSQGFFGGFAFTDKPGLLANFYGIPTTFALFDKDGSTSFQEDFSNYRSPILSSGGNWKITLPDGAMLFQDLTTLPRQSRGTYIFDRKQ